MWVASVDVKQNINGEKCGCRIPLPNSKHWFTTSFLLFFIFFFFLTPGVVASHVYVRASALGCFHGLISTQTFWRALTASVDSCAEIKECPFSGVTSAGRRVPDSDARSQTPSTDLRHPSFGGGSQKTMLGVCPLASVSFSGTGLYLKTPSSVTAGPATSRGLFDLVEDSGDAGTDLAWQRRCVQHGRTRTLAFVVGTQPRYPSLSKRD